MRNALHALAVFAGIAVLTGTAIPAGAQEPADDPQTAPEEATPEETPLEETAPEETAPEETAPEETAPVDELAPPEAATPVTAEEESPLASPVEAAESANATDAVGTEPPADEEAVAVVEAEDASEEAAPARRGPALSFANSFFTYTNALTVHTLAPEAQLTYNPTWLMSFGLTPRFYLTDTTFLWLNQGLFLELTDSDGDTYNHEPLLTDTTLDLRQNIAWEGFVIQAQARLVFPLSKASQSAQRILQTGVGLSITRPFPELASFTVSATAGYRRWWATSNVARIMPGGEPDYTNGAGGAECEAGLQPYCTQAGGLTTARDIVVTGLAFSVMPFAGFTVQLQAFYMGMYGHEVAPTAVDINGGSQTIVDDSPTHWRHFTSFVFAVGYDVLPYLNLSLGIQNAGVAAPLYNPDGSVRSPFNPDTQVYLSATLGLDTMVNELVGNSEEDDLTPEQRQRRRQGLAQRGEVSTF